MVSASIKLGRPDHLYDPFQDRPNAEDIALTTRTLRPSSSTAEGYTASPYLQITFKICSGMSALPARTCASDRNF